MKNPLGLLLFILFWVLSNVPLSGQQSYSSVEETVLYINELLSKNDHSEEYKISSVNNDLIVIDVIRSKSKDVVESLEKDGKSINDYPAFEVLRKEANGSVVTESKSAMVISSMKKFTVKMDQSNPYPQSMLIYFQNVQMLTWDYLNSIWALSTWNYFGLSFTGSDKDFENLFNAWNYLISEVVKREDLIDDN